MTGKIRVKWMMTGGYLSPPHRYLQNSTSTDSRFEWIIPVQDLLNLQEAPSGIGGHPGRSPQGMKNGVVHQADHAREMTTAGQLPVDFDIICPIKTWIQILQKWGLSRGVDGWGVDGCGLFLKDPFEPGKCDRVRVNLHPATSTSRWSVGIGDSHA